MFFYKINIKQEKKKGEKRKENICSLCINRYYRPWAGLRACRRCWPSPWGAAIVMGLLSSLCTYSYGYALYMISM